MYPVYYYAQVDPPRIKYGRRFLHLVLSAEILSHLDEPNRDGNLIDQPTHGTIALPTSLERQGHPDMRRMHV